MPTIEITDKEAAIVFREDGAFELFLAHQEDDEEMIPTSLNAARIALTLDNERVQKIVDEEFDKIMGEREYKAASTVNRINELAEEAAECIFHNGLDLDEAQKYIASMLAHWAVEITE